MITMYNLINDTTPETLREFITCAIALVSCAIVFFYNGTPFQKN